jgi:hypothetical protein
MVTVAHYLPGPTSKLPGVQMPALVLRRSVFLWGLSALLLGTLASPAVAQQLSARSGPQTVALLELYTSEGCNSCPPADVLVRSLAAKGLTLDRVVSLGLHVDYWDALGWPDRFAQAIFTQRQREIAARQRTRTVYTPQLVLHGRALSTWGALDAEVQRINHTQARADLSLEATSQAPNTLEVMAQAVVPEAAARPHTHMYLALYENRLTSVVTAGENAGHTLRHDYVVRQWFGPLAIDTQGTAHLQQTLSLHRDWKTSDLGLVIFVQQHQTGEVLQALALPLGQ